MRLLIIILVVSMFNVGCSNLPKSVMAGAAVGGAGGAAIGSAHGRNGHRGQKTFQGGLIGATIGGLVGFLGFKDKVKKQKKKNIKQNDAKDESPVLTRPRVKKIWVEDKVIGNRYIKGHWEFVIKENSKWNQ